MNILHYKQQDEPFTASAPASGRISLRGKNIFLHLAAKRLLDLTLSACALIVLLPLLIVVSAAIKLESSGPVCFRQRRWGKDREVINVYKFRSMYVEQCDLSGVAQTVRDDPRITRVGKVIRRFNIDELPQLINVMRGEMSLVGPRCHAVGMLAAGKLYEDLVPAYHQRHAMRPGLTGLAQMRGLRGPTDQASKARARIACDLHYVQHFSIWMDMSIIVGTIQSELKGGAGF